MGLFNKEKVYCQICGERILEGGYVSDANSSYHSTQTCIPTKNLKDEHVTIMNREEIQQAILNGNLIHYRKLEKSLSK